MYIILGVVTGLKGEFITQVALGKAHAVALTKKGTVYSFGINNKFQCGREFITSSKEGKNVKVMYLYTLILTSLFLFYFIKWAWLG